MLKAEELSFRYAGSRDWAIKDVSLEVHKGECILLAGPSGCGKSTLIKCFNGLVPHFEKGVRTGRVWLDGTDMAQMAMHEIAQRTGAVFQNPRSQFFTTYVADEIAFGCENSGMPRKKMISRMDEALERFGITHLRDRRIFNLSSGEQQKVILASIYVMGVDIWVMDEPSANLDDSAIEALEKIIGALRREGKTIIIAEHRCHYLKDHADRIVILDKGRLSSIDTGDSFFNQNHRAPSRKWAVPASGKNRGPAPGITRGIFSGKSLHLDNLSFCYPESGILTLDGINLSVSGGEIAAITGNNGSGKTTMAMIIAGLVKEKSGKIYLNGSAVSARERSRHCRMVLQEADHQLFTESVYRELEIGLEHPKKNPGKILQILEGAGLDNISNRRPHSLSGGEKQRLAVAAALVAEPDILILDEPTSGLDTDNMKRMGALLQIAALRGAVVMVITHDREFIKNCCTKVLRMEKGGIINE